MLQIEIPAKRIAKERILRDIAIHTELRSDTTYIVASRVPEDIATLQERGAL